MPFDSTDSNVLTEQDASDLHVLRVVRRYINEGVWIKGKFIDPKTGGRCLAGWVAVVAGRENFDYGIYESAVRITAHHLAPLISPQNGEDGLVDRVMRFNDLKKTKRSDVLNVLDQAILKLECTTSPHDAEIGA